MASTLPSAAQRTVFAVITASALGSGCYAWISRGVGSKGFDIWQERTMDPRSFMSGTAAFCAANSPPSGGSVADKDGDCIDGKSLKPLVVCGPSGVGKGTLISMLMNDYPGRFGFSVSHTTRKPRPGEVHGTHYHFSEKEAMQKEIDEHKFIEHANVHGNLYGTSIAAVQDVTARDKVCILDIDVQGVKSVREAGITVLDPHYLFISPPSMEALEARLRGRGTENEDQLDRRLANSKMEMEYGHTQGNFEKILVNDNLMETYAELIETAKHWYPQLQRGGEAEGDASSATPMS